MIDLETIITELVVNGGEARGKALNAVHAAKNNEMEKAEALMIECKKALSVAHNFQTNMIQQTLNPEVEEKDTYASLLMVHGQDHLMDAMVVKDLAQEMIDIYKIIYSMKER